MNDQNTPQLPLDFTLIDKYIEPFLNQFQLLTGVDCFKVAKTMLSVSSTMFFVVNLYYLIMVEKLKPATAITALFTSFLILVNFYILNQRLKRIERRMSIGSRNLEIFKSRNNFIALVIAFFGYCVIDMLFFNNKSGGFLFFICTLVLYSHYAAAACTPLPPSKSEVGKILDKIKEVLKGGQSLVPQS